MIVPSQRVYADGFFCDEQLFAVFARSLRAAPDAMVLCQANMRALCRFEAVQRREQPRPSDERTSAFIWKMLEAEVRAETKATEQDWASNVVIAFLAGHETTRWSSVALVMFIMKHERVLHKLQDEMHAVQDVRTLASLPAVQHGLAHCNCCCTSLRLRARQRVWELRVLWVATPAVRTYWRQPHECLSHFTFRAAHRASSLLNM